MSAFLEWRERVEHNADAIDIQTPGCLVCGESLHAWESWMLCPECRYYYPREMIAEADPLDWRAIQLGGFACTRCPQVLPNVPRVHIGDDGLPMFCPVPPVKPKPQTKQTRMQALCERVRHERERMLWAWHYYREET